MKQQTNLTEPELNQPTGVQKKQVLCIGIEDDLFTRIKHFSSDMIISGNICCDNDVIINTKLEPSPDLIICSSRLDTLQCLVEEFPKTPVIFLTNAIDKSTIVEAFNIGALDVISKPYSNEKIAAKITTLITYLYNKENLRYKSIKQHLGSLLVNPE